MTRMGPGLKRDQHDFVDGSLPAGKTRDNLMNAFHVMRPVTLCCLLVSLPASAQSQRAFPVPATNDETGFELIFDGKSLKGWEGDTNYWRVENGGLVGEVTPDKDRKS